MERERERERMERITNATFPATVAARRPLTNGVPLTNGIPLTNGSPLKKGTTLTNGIPLTNGTTLTNGTPLIRRTPPDAIGARRPPSPSLSADEDQFVVREPSSRPANLAGDSSNWKMAMAMISAQELKLEQQENALSKAQEEMSQQQTAMMDEYQLRFKFLDNLSEVLKSIDEEELEAFLKDLVSKSDSSRSRSKSGSDSDSDSDSSSSSRVRMGEITPPVEAARPERAEQASHERRDGEVVKLRRQLKRTLQMLSKSDSRIKTQRKRYRFMMRGHFRVASKLARENSIWAWKHDRVYKFAKRMTTLTGETLMSGVELGAEREELRATLRSLNGWNTKSTRKRAYPIKNKNLSRRGMRIGSYKRSAWIAAGAA